MYGSTLIKIRKIFIFFRKENGIFCERTQQLLVVVVFTMAGSRKRSATAVYRPVKKGRYEKGAKPRYFQVSKVNRPKAKPISSNSTTFTRNLHYHTTHANESIAASSAVLRVVNLNNLVSYPYMGSDECYALFKDCYVKSVRAQVNLSCNTSSAELHAAVWIDDVNTNSASLSQSLERAGSKGGKIMHGYYGANTMKQEPLFFDVNETTWNVFRSGIAENDNKQNNASGPTNLMYLHIEVWNGSTALAADATGLQTQIHLECEAIFMNPVELNVSA